MTDSVSDSRKNLEKVTAGVLIIGDEILSGRTQDTNLNAIARYLLAYGVDVMEARVVGDKETEIIPALEALRQSYDYVFTTGGIGPTHDDITVDCIAKALGLKLYEDPDIIADLASYHKEPPNPARRRMARLPEGASKVHNPTKGPPGFQIQNIFVLAGVPAVMRGMLQDIGPRLKTGAIVISKTLRIDGFGEGMIAAPLEKVARSYRDLSLGSYPFYSDKGVGSHLIIRGRDAEKVAKAEAELIAGLEQAGIDRITQIIEDR